MLNIQKGLALLGQAPPDGHYDVMHVLCVGIDGVGHYGIRPTQQLVDPALRLVHVVPGGRVDGFNAIAGVEMAIARATVGVGDGGGDVNALHG